MGPRGSRPGPRGRWPAKTRANNTFSSRRSHTTREPRRSSKAVFFSLKKSTKFTKTRLPPPCTICVSEISTPRGLKVSSLLLGRSRRSLSLFLSLFHFPSLQISLSMVSLLCKPFADRDCVRPLKLLNSHQSTTCHNSPQNVPKVDSSKSRLRETAAPAARKVFVADQVVAPSLGRARRVPLPATRA